MSRKPLHTEAAAITITDTDTPGLPNMKAAADQLALHSALIADQFGDGLVYERERLIGETRLLLANSAETMLAAGKRLIQIKENEAHGDFIEIVERRLGLNYRTGAKMMKAAIKFLSPKVLSNVNTYSHLGKSKLFELMTEDDDDLAALAEGGTVAGLNLGDMDRMTARELKAALSEARENNLAKERLMAEKDIKINDMNLVINKRRVSLTDWPAEFTGYLSQVRMALTAIETNLSALDIIRADAMLITAAPEGQAALDKARNALGLELLSAISRGEDLIGAVRHTFDRTLGALINN